MKTNTTAKSRNDNGKRAATKSTLLGLAVWNPSEIGQGGTLAVQKGMTLHIPDHSTWISWNEDPEKNVPHCILQYLCANDGD